jgi:hypothetical protein
MNLDMELRWKFKKLVEAIAVEMLTSIGLHVVYDRCKMSTT